MSGKSETSARGSPKRDNRPVKAGTGRAERSDRRSLRSRAALRSALIALLECKLYEEITVQDIVDQANVGRSTFYAHCSGKDDLLRLSLRLLGSELAADRDAARSDLENDRVFAFSLPVLAHVFDHRRLYPAISHGRARDVFMSEMRAIVRELVRAELPQSAGSRGAPSDVALEYFTGAFMALLGWWVEHQVRRPVTEMDAAFQDLARRGISAAAA